MIEIINLNKTIKTTKHTNTKILEDINLKIEQGDFVGVIGESGAGKSSFLRSINLLDRPSSGEIIIDKQNILFFNEKELLSLRRNIGMIFQSFCLLSTKNVEQNIALPMKLQKLDATSIKNKVNELLDLVNLSDKRKEYPAQLSGGQKQRVAIARALSCSPKLLLCDEPTSALDPKNTNIILELLDNINKKLGITIILVSHDISSINRFCNKIVTMEFGKIQHIDLCDKGINNG